MLSLRFSIWPYFLFKQDAVIAEAKTKLIKMESALMRSMYWISWHEVLPVRSGQWALCVRLLLAAPGAGRGAHVDVPRAAAALLQQQSPPAGKGRAQVPPRGGRRPRYRPPTVSPRSACCRKDGWPMSDALSAGHGSVFSCCNSARLEGQPTTTFFIYALGSAIVFITDGIIVSGPIKLFSCRLKGFLPPGVKIMSLLKPY